MEANTNLYKVKDIGSIIPDNFSETIKDKAISNVAIDTKRWALNILIMNIPFIK